MRVLKGLFFLVLVGCVGVGLVVVVSIVPWFYLRASAPHPALVFSPRPSAMVSPLVPWLVLAGAVVVGALVVLFLAWLFFGGERRRHDGSARASEEQMIYAIHRSLGGMEKRIEALETILLEHAGEHGRPREFDSRLGV